MHSVSGKIAELLRDTVGRVNGFSLDTGEEIRSSASELDLLASRISLGSHIALGGEVQYTGGGQRVLECSR